MSETDPDLVVPFMMRAWMDKVEAFCNKVDAFLTEVELRLVTLENDTAQWQSEHNDCFDEVEHRLSILEAWAHG